MSAVTNQQSESVVSPTLIDAIESFPTSREVSHCGREFSVSPFHIYATCPACGSRIKLRGFSETPELEDVFDAVFAWMSRADAKQAVREGLKSMDEGGVSNPAKPLDGTPLPAIEWAMIEDRVWADDQYLQGVWKDHVGQYAVIADQQVLGFTDDPEALTRDLARAKGCPAWRFIVLWVSPDPRAVFPY